MSGQPNIEELNKTASQVRRDIVRMVHGCQSGHPGGSLGCTDYFVALYFQVMRRSEGFNMDGQGEDLSSFPMDISAPCGTVFWPDPAISHSMN